MVATISQVSEGIKTRLLTVSGLRVLDYMPDTVNPPLAFINLTKIEYHRAFGAGGVQFTYTVGVVVGRVSERSGQARLDDYMSYSGAQSIRAALEGDLTLGGVVDSLILSDSANVSSLTIGDANFIAVDFSLLVIG
jgi:hypothetical protein